MPSITYSPVPVILDRGEDSKLTAWLVPGRGYYSCSGGAVLPFLAYDLMAAGEVPDSEAHHIASDFFNGLLTEEEHAVGEARLRELGYSNEAIATIGDDMDPLLYDHMAAQGCIGVWAPWERISDYAAEVFGSPVVLDTNAQRGIALALAMTGAFEEGNRVRFSDSHDRPIGVMEIHKAV